MVDEMFGRRRYRVLAMALAVLACVLAVPAVASAEFTITVNSTADEADLGPDGICLTAGGECTLRAAIEEANFDEENNEVAFDEDVFDGQVSGTISLGASLPAIKDGDFINGECVTAGGVLRPCAGIDGPSGEPALIVDGTEEAAIEGLAVTGARIGISVEGSSHFKVINTWLGVGLDGSLEGNATGVFVGPGSNRSHIGSEGVATGNVFAGNTEEGLDILGAREVAVLGNFFGVKPDGTTVAANGKDIEVSSIGAFEAAGTTIGTRVNPLAAATPVCDGGCNLISGATSSGIDLEGDGAFEEAPASATTIAGNYIGLDATGNAAIPNASAGIHVGRAAQTVIGGPKSGEANRINGGSAGVLAGPEAADLSVRGNLIGVDAAGAVLAPPDEAIFVNSGEFSTPAFEALIAGNEIGMEGGVAISQQGYGAWISGNEIAGAETGIRIFESIAEHGNLIEGNSIEGAKASGILVENDLNEILGNEVSGAGDAGIAIRGLEPFGVSGNLIGGNAAADENVVSGSGGAAIEISDVNTSVNEVARNRGGANGGPFIDLVPAGTESKDPNNGIEPPVVSTAIEASAGGSAEEGAVVRVFRKQTAAAGEVDSFLGEAIADAGGNWKVVYGSAIPGGAFVAATQTKNGGTSELSTPVAVAGSGSGGGGEGDAGSGAGTAGSFDRALTQTRARPRTKIVSGPRKRSRNRTARFEFKADEPGSVFLCKLDDKPFDLCKSPKKYRELKPGRHVFKVRAIDPAGRVDSSPATTKFTVVG
jgi:CSLREA domain-containing protein